MHTSDATSIPQGETKMHTEIIKNTDGTYNLLVNGKMQISSETLSVVLNIERCFEYPEAVPTECGEVAASIMAVIS
jgi:hypothetical protein